MLLIPPPGGGTPAAGSITNAMLANMATARIKGRVTAGTGAPEDLTIQQVLSLQTGLGYTAGVLQTGVFAGAGVASTPAMKLNGAWFSGGSGTTTKPQFLIEPVGAVSTNWNPLGTGFAVNGPNGHAGFLADFQQDGDSCLSIKYSANGPQIKSASGLGINQWINNTECYLTTANGGAASSAGGIRVASDVWIGWSSGAANAADQDTSIQRISAGILAVKTDSGNQSKLRVFESAGTKYVEASHNGTNATLLFSSGTLVLTALPTSSAGLASGALYTTAGAVFQVA